MYKIKVLFKRKDRLSFHDSFNVHLRVPPRDVSDWGLRVWG